MKTLIMMCGVPGSGKSTLAKFLCAGYVAYVSRDEIRKELVGEYVTNEKYFSRENEVFNTFVKRINDVLINENDVDMVIADATHLDACSRAKLLRCLHTEDVSLIVLPVHCSLETALCRNAQRTGFARVPDNVIKKMYRNYSEPTKKEFEKYKFHNVEIAPIINESNESTEIDA